jgi:hypothetical protein
MKRTLIITVLLMTAVIAAAESSAAPALEDPVLPGMNLADARIDYRAALKGLDWDISWDDWCLWGKKEDLEDVAYCFDDAGNLLTIEYNRRCPDDTWSAVYLELSDTLTDLMGPKTAVGGGDADYWSGGGWNAELSAKYLDEADGLDPVVHLEIYR